MWKNLYSCYERKMELPNYFIISLFNITVQQMKGGVHLLLLNTFELLGLV